VSKKFNRTRRAPAAAFVLLLAAAPLAGCAEAPFSMLDTAGPGADSIARVWWVMFWGSLAILVLMMALGFMAVFRAPHRRREISGRAFILGGGIAFPFLVLLVLLVYGLRSGQALLPLPTDRDVYRVEVRAHQWWWEVRYPDAPGGPLHTANEIHVPAGRPVDIHLTAADVIHSFWVPRLGGKIDAIPGRTNIIRLEAHAPGVYRGQCAEFCGAQHARMHFSFEAHSADGLNAYLASLADSAVPPGPGAPAFQAHCAACHSVDPREHAGGMAPNLAGLPGRATLGAGTLANGPGALPRWLREHQTLKPGNRMPPHELDDATLDAIAGYLEAGR
jgi:cytochrome c oxidase subunit II